ncbi:hypothetical protein [Paracoccus sp. 22332]|uniref:hypothetical protein n=1 Tax=Paracoccus sp. 22332 TaxID=3453913 RepID=UPI003F841C43
MTQDKWPSHGPDFNEWHDKLPEFIALIEEAKGEGFWCSDWDLKYLTIRIDTRDNGWLLFVDGMNGEKKERIDPQRVVQVIEKHRERWGRSKPYAKRGSKEGRDNPR